jgi:hypothetical protein
MFEPYSRPVLERCIKIINNVLTQIKDSDDNKFIDKEFLIRSIDLLSALFVALEERSEALITGTNFISLILECMQVSFIRLNTPAAK